MLRPVAKATTEITRVPYGVCTITVQANGGTCDVLMLHEYVDGGAGDVWVPAVAQFVADGAQTLFPGRDATLKIVPAGGAKWTIHGDGF